MKGYHSTIIALLIVASTATNVSIKKSGCPPGNQIVSLPHPSECTLYYICENGRKTIQTCPGGLHFNPIIRQCDYPPAGCLPWLVDLEISEETKSDKADPSRCVGECPIIDPVDKTVQLPYADDCGKFCSCSNGVPYVIDCPKGLHYDKKLEICNWPWEANCE